MQGRSSISLLKLAVYDVELWRSSRLVTRFLEVILSMLLGIESQGLRTFDSPRRKEK